MNDNTITTIATTRTSQAALRNALTTPPKPSRATTISTIPIISSGSMGLLPVHGRMDLTLDEALRTEHARWREKASKLQRFGQPLPIGRN